MDGSPCWDWAVPTQLQAWEEAEGGAARRGGSCSGTGLKEALELLQGWRGSRRWREAVLCVCPRQGGEPVGDIALGWCLPQGGPILPKVAVMLGPQRFIGGLWPCPLYLQGDRVGG